MNKLSTIVAKNGIEEDLQNIATMFSLPTLHYIDVQLQAQLDQMSNRWPLLIELTQLDNKRSEQ